ncbi:polysaccharide biosynthesis/export family protein [Bacteroidales bacterium OttesenSCG-928-M11]|nr:polysaccharide biosynthesis/export family protein [Bacteroidales bacterium OttesenSCG-928-M11]
MKVRLTLFLLVAIVFSSCRSVPKDVVYFEDLKTQVFQKDYYKYEPTIKTNDQLLITVSAPVSNQSKVAQFNLPMNSYLAPGETTVLNSAAIQTYTVDKEGYINFPEIGKMKLAGLSRSAAIELITEKVSDYISDATPVVNLQIISFKVNVIGEVNKPGFVDVTDERISIFDALAAVGDMTIYGDRKNVKLIRENNGQLESVVLDLTTSEIFNSPYYYLQQNDLLYIEQNDTKKKESKFGSAENYKLSIVSISVSVVSVIASALVAILK